MATSEGKLERVITPRAGWLDIDLRELWEAREIVFRFVQRDLTTSYKQTVLGPFWLILPPIVSTVVFTILFARIAKISTNDTPPFLFYMSGVVLWTFFSSGVSKTSITFSGNASIFGKVYFPRLAVPLAGVLVNFSTLMVQSAIFAGFYLWSRYTGSHVAPNLYALALPLVLVQLAALGAGVGFAVASLTTRYRDFGMMITYGLQLWMYASSIVYPLSALSETWQKIAMINPVVPVVEFTRYALFSTGSFDPTALGISSAVSLFIFLMGLALFRHMEGTFMDTI